MEAKKIKLLSQKYFQKVVEIRRYLHKNPELSYKEFQTSEFIISILKTLDIPYKSGVAGNGIVAEIKGKQKAGNKKSKVIALRADMDALPITEENKVEYASCNKGVMHACGHDAHVASLLGTAMILKELESEFSGTIILIFQPAEEKVPGGAKAMLESGIFNDKKPDVIFAQHVESAMDSGKVGFKSGIYMASTDEIYLTVKGKGGHGAMPHLNIDPVLISAHIIVALQQVVSRIANPAIPSVLSFGKIIGNGATNIIPDDVKIEGTFRTTDENWRKEAHARMKKIAKSIVEGMGGKCEFKVLNGYPVLINNEQATNAANKLAVEYLGANNVEALSLKMTAEDFAYFAQEYPAVFYRLGIRNEKKNICSAIHTSIFNIDEESLKTSMGFMAWLALSSL